MGQLYRSSDKVIAGVCGGLAENFGMDAKIMRIITVVAALLTGGIVLIAYLILALLLPAKN